jgi:hypothetical protein
MRKFMKGGTTKLSILDKNQSIDTIDSMETLPALVWSEKSLSEV